MSELSDKEKEMVEEALFEYCDEGSHGFVWKSEELKQAIEKAVKILGIER